MQQRLSILTLKVHDLPAMQRFYTQLFGWKPAAANRDIAFFQLNGFLLSLYGDPELAAYPNLPLTGGRAGSRGFTMAYNVSSVQGVQELYEHFLRKGVRILKEPFAPPYGGRMFSFADPEENEWEVAYNPYIPLDEQGNAVTHLPIDHL